MDAIQEFPKMLYRGANETKIVASREEQDAAEGWFESADAAAEKADGSDLVEDTPAAKTAKAKKG